jgi:RES domain-containing protein
MRGRPNLAAIASASPTRFSGLVFRVVPETRREQLLSTEGNRYYPGRYHVAGETGVLYTSLVEEVAIAEIGRHAAPAHVQGRLATGRIEITLQRVLDLGDEANLATLGLSGEDLISPNWALTQALSVRARKAGFQGLLVPSATSRGGNLVVFGDNLGEGCSVEVVRIRILPED